MSMLRVSVPGQPVRLIPEQAAKLTKRQEEVLHIVRSFGGNRHRAARHLGVSSQSVVNTLQAAQRHGAAIPPGVTRKGILNSEPRRDKKPRCGMMMERSHQPCGRPVGHPPSCRSPRACARQRTTERTMFR